MDINREKKVSDMCSHTEVWYGELLVILRSFNVVGVSVDESKCYLCLIQKKNVICVNRKNVTCIYDAILSQKLSKFFIKNKGDH